MQHIT